MTIYFCDDSTIATAPVTDTGDINVQTNVLSSEYGFGSNNTYGAAMTTSISKEAGKDILVQAQCNFRHHIYNGNSYTAGGVHVYFKLMRRIGASGDWNQIGAELAIDDLFEASFVSTNSSGHWLDAHGGISAPDASITTTAAPSSAPLYYALYAKWVGYGRFGSTPGSYSTNLAVMCPGSSIVCMEY